MSDATDDTVTLDVEMPNWAFTAIRALVAAGRVHEACACLHHFVPEITDPGMLVQAVSEIVKGGES